MRGAIRTLRDARTREFLLWCAPALLLALALRTALCLQLPYACFRDDTHDFLLTPDSLFSGHGFILEWKKTFLVPIFFTLACLTPVPGLIVMAIVQHLLGVGAVLITGMLTRLWFERWRVFIIPVTCVIAANPSLIWFEHTLMAETTFVFATLLLALAGTVYAPRQSSARFIFLLAALFLVATARPEGKLFVGFIALLLLALHAREWRKRWPRFLTLAIFAVLLHFITRTGESGVLLYTSVARLTPSDLKSAPDFDPYIAPMRGELHRRWESTRTFPDVEERHAIEKIVARYLAAHQRHRRVQRRHVDRLCRKMAVEICRRNLLALPAHVYWKFRAVSNQLPGGTFDHDTLFEYQHLVANDRTGRTLRLSQRLTGTTLADANALNQFIDLHYAEVPWFNSWHAAWRTAVNCLRFPDAGEALRYLPGVPIYFCLAMFGVIAAAFRRRALQPFHLAWSVWLLCYFVLIILTANVRPRFRFVFEPFWFIYIGLLCDCIWRVLARYLPAKGKPATAGRT